MVACNGRNHIFVIIAIIVAAGEILLMVAMLAAQDAGKIIAMLARYFDEYHGVAPSVKRGAVFPAAMLSIYAGHIKQCFTPFTEYRYIR